MYWMRFSLVVALLACTAVPAFGVQESTQAKALLELMKSRDQAIQKIVRSKTGGETPAERAQLKNLVGELFDFRSFAKESLGRYWNERTDAERKEFVDLCRRLIEKNYGDPKLYTKSEKIDYVDAEVNGTEGTVKTVVHYKTDKSTVEYKLHPVDGTWRIYDMVIDDLSIARNNRSQFYKEIRKSSYAGLVQKLKDKLVEDDKGGKGKD